jgi:hypothetical protein
MFAADARQNAFLNASAILAECPETAPSCRLDVAKIAMLQCFCNLL